MLGKASLPLKVNSSPKDLWTEIILKETALLHTTSWKKNRDSFNSCIVQSQKINQEKRTFELKSGFKQVIF